MACSDVIDDNGVFVDVTCLSGYIWAENVGWINVGNGGCPYLNADGSNSGVNVEPNGDLDGYAWGENIGWVNFGWAAGSQLQGPGSARPIARATLAQDPLRQPPRRLYELRIVHQQQGLAG